MHIQPLGKGGTHSHASNNKGHLKNLLSHHIQCFVRKKDKSHEESQVETRSNHDLGMMKPLKLWVDNENTGRKKISPPTQAHIVNRHNIKISIIKGGKVLSPRLPVLT